MQGVVVTVGLDGRMDLMILEVSSNLNDSVTIVVGAVQTWNSCSSQEFPGCRSRQKNQGDCGAAAL